MGRGRGPHRHRAGRHGHRRPRRPGRLDRARAGPRHPRPAPVHLRLHRRPQGRHGQPRQPAAQRHVPHQAVRHDRPQPVRILDPALPRHGPDGAAHPAASARRLLRADEPDDLPQAAALVAEDDRRLRPRLVARAELRLRTVRPDDHRRAARRPRPLPLDVRAQRLRARTGRHAHRLRQALRARRIPRRRLRPLLRTRRVHRLRLRHRTA